MYLLLYFHILNDVSIYCSNLYLHLKVWDWGVNSYVHNPEVATR